MMHNAAGVDSANVVALIPSAAANAPRGANLRRTGNMRGEAHGDPGSRDRAAQLAILEPVVMA